MLWAVSRQLRKLASERPEQQISALQSLGRSRDPRALRPLFDFFVRYSSTFPAHGAALEALTGYRDQESLEFFLGNLTKPEDDARVDAAAEVLAAMKHRDAIGPLLHVLQEGSGTRGVARALTKLEAFEPLAELMHSGLLSSSTLTSLLVAFRESRNPACIGLLLPLLQSSDFSLRRHTIETIRAIDGEAARQALMRILPSLDFEGLLLCVPAIALSENEWLHSALRPYYQIYRAYFEPSYALDSDCIEKLLAILQSRDESARGRAFVAGRLGKNPDARTVVTLREIMRSGVPGVWRETARALRSLPDGAKDGLDHLLLALVMGELSGLDGAAKAAVPSLPCTVVEALIEEDPRNAARVIEQLQQNGWKPRSSGETAVYHILRKEWGQLAATGQACIGPLVEVALNDSGCFDDETRREAASALEAAVENVLAELPEKTLRYLANLGDVIRVEEQVGAEIKNYIYCWTTMRSCIQRELERREAARRSPTAVGEKRNPDC